MCGLPKSLLWFDQMMMWVTLGAFRVKAYFPQKFKFWSLRYSKTYLHVQAINLSLTKTSFYIFSFLCTLDTLMNHGMVKRFCINQQEKATKTGWNQSDDMWRKAVRGVKRGAAFKCKAEFLRQTSKSSLKAAVLFWFCDWWQAWFKCRCHRWTSAYRWLTHHCSELLNFW